MIALSPLLPENAPPRILLLGAHSDDIEIGCGATVLQLARFYPEARFLWCVFSGTGPRLDEAQKSAEAFLAEARHPEICLHNFRDGFFPSQHALIKEQFEALKQNFAPDIIFTHYRNDLHQDHRVISELARNTWRSHLLLEYEIPKYDGDLDRPNLFVPIDEDSLARKIELLLTHFPTQASKHWFDEATFRALPRLRGLECHSPTGHAEAFHAFKVRFCL